MNKVIISGNITNDLELKESNNKHYLSFSLAVKRDYKNPQGEYETDFINISTFGNTSEFISKYCKKGDRIMIEGNIRNSKYTDKEGKERYITNVLAEKVELIRTANKKQDDASVKMNEIEVKDEDLPF